MQRQNHRGTHNGLIAGGCRAVCLATVGALVLPAMTEAADVTLIASDAFGASSFDTAGNWSNGSAPSPGNNYFTGDFLFRTPVGEGPYTFQGDSLTINPTAFDLNRSLILKGPGYTVTVNNLILDGGYIRHGEGSTQQFTLAGNLHITDKGGRFQVQGPLNVASAISGTSTIQIDSPGNNDVERTLTFTSPDSTFTGSINVLDGGGSPSRFRLGETGVLNFAIGSNGINNSVYGNGIATFDGTFVFDLSGASANPGDSWTIVDVATLTETFGATFSVAGFTESGDVWTNGQYEFSEVTGILSVVVPEPTGLVLLGLGACGILARRRA